MLGKFAGALLIVSGTSIGATTLALPLTLSSGFWPSILLLFAIWFLAFQASLVNIEINKTYPNIFCLSKLCKRVFANKLFIIADLAIIILFYSLICAYISGIHTVVSCNIGLSSLNELFLSVFLVLLFMIIIVSKMKILDISNKIIFFAKALVFIALIVIISSTQDNFILPSLTTVQVEANFFIIAVPIIFTAFGFHGCIPMIIKYLEADHKLVKKSFLYGSLLSLLIYSVWVFAINGIIPAQGDESLMQIKKASNPLAQLITTITYFVGHSNFRILIEAFGFLAIITSLFGVGASLYDYFLDRYLSRVKFSKIYAVILTFLPPILIIIINKDIFIQALAFAAIFLSLIAIILPNLINMRINHSTGNNFRSVALLTAGGLIILFEIMNLLSGYLEKLF